MYRPTVQLILICDVEIFVMYSHITS